MRESAIPRPAAGAALVLIAALLLSLLAVGVPISRVDAVEPSATGRYIVVLEEPPLARYDGGIAGLAPTTPSVTGARKLDVTSAASLAYLAYLDGRQTAVQNALAAAIGHPVEVVLEYTAVVNGFAAILTPAEAAAAQGVPGVRAVVADQVRELLTDNGPAWIGADTVWSGNGGGAGTMGEGVVVGVIDTGVNHDHESFADVGGDGYNHTNPRGTFTGACDPVTGLPFCNDKLIGVWDFTGTTPEDDNGHGSHTASTAAGNVLDAGFETPTRTFNRPISGVAPHANLITYKACSGTTAAAAECTLVWILGGINAAVLDMVDVINFSIGGASEDPWVSLDAQAFLDVRAAGIFAAVSAGNDGPGASTIGSPADAPWVTAVGAATHDRALFNSVVDMAGGGTTPPADILGKSLTAGLESAPIVYAGEYGFPLCGEGEALATGEALINPFPAGTFNGEIVVCDRGTYGRVEKAQNVAEAGAGGFVLANDQANGDSLVGDAYPIPGVHISYANGVVLKTWIASSGEDHAAAISGTVLDENPANGDVTASFSSRGPNPATGDVLKPDITGPGVDILAAFNTPFTDLLGAGGEYGVISGTSMSSPHVAGSGALMVALHPDWSPAEVQSALMTTSLQGVRKEDGSTAADPFDMGSGRVNLHAAGHAGLVFDETFENYEKADPSAGGDPSTLNTASLAEDACAGTCEWQRLVTSTAAGDVTWTASSSAANFGVTVEPASFTIAPGETLRITITADATAAPLDAWSFGSVLLTSGGAPAVHMPVAVYTTVPETEFGTPELTDPGDEVNTTGSYTLEWTDVDGEAGYVVQQSTDYDVAFTDDAEDGMAGRWTTSNEPLQGWTESSLQANSGSQSYWSGNTDEKTVTLTLAEPVTVPDGAEALLSFASYEDTEPDFDYGYVEASSDGGATWVEFAKVNGWSDGWVDRSATLRGMNGEVLVRFRYVTDQLISAPLYTGWWIDDITISVGTWSATGETAADATSLDVTDQESGTWYHRVAGLYDTGGAELVVGPWSNVVDIVVERPPEPNLSVTSMDAQNRRGRASERVALLATITNDGDGDAPETVTTFARDDGTEIGSADTPALAPGESATVEVRWDTRHLRGEYVVTATADATTLADEVDEEDNVGTLTVEIRGNRVRNASFEEPTQDGSAPAGWTGTSTDAGTTSYDEGGSEGQRSVTITGSGGNAATAGVPTWTSDPIQVAAGEVLNLTASVRSSGMSSTPSIGLVYLGPAGQVLESVVVAPAALLTDGFEELDELVTIPVGVSQVRVVLAGFAPTDLATAGSVTFDEVGLFGD